MTRNERRGSVPSYTPPGLATPPRAEPPRPAPAMHAPETPPPVEEGPTSPVVRSAPEKVRSIRPRPERGTTGKPGPLSGRPFAQRFAEWLECGGFTRAEAARKLGVAPPRVSEWCNGRRAPSGPRLVTIAETLGLDLNALKSEP